MSHLIAGSGAARLDKGSLARRAACVFIHLAHGVRIFGSRAAPAAPGAFGVGMRRELRSLWRISASGDLTVHFPTAGHIMVGTIQLSALCHGWLRVDFKAVSIRNEAEPSHICERVPQISEPHKEHVDSKTKLLLSSR